ncbi:MAG: cytochrome c oxidase assembly protein [Acidimicrobiales bacterium]
MLIALATAESTADSVSLGDIGWNAHPEVWTLIIGIIALGWWVFRVLQPKAVAAGYPPISRRQVAWFVAATVSMWVASDWPVHDVAEQYLYFVHMFQHMFISMLVPAMFLLSMPMWLFDLVIPEGTTARRVLRYASRPLVAGIVFNVLTMVLHWSLLVTLSAENGALHYGLHLMIFISGLLMWMPVVGPVREWRLQPLAQCFYLFGMSIVPTVPGGWLVFAEDVVYRSYDVPQRLWGVDVLADQQMAGVVMKIVGGFVLWAIIVIIFGRWASTEVGKDLDAVRSRDRARTDRELTALAEDEPLTVNDISARFAESDAPEERVP